MALFRLEYPGELSPAERAALSLSGFAHRATLGPASAGYGGRLEAEEEEKKGKPTQVVDVNAGSAGEARRRLIAALGREPPDLTVEPLTEA